MVYHFIVHQIPFRVPKISRVFIVLGMFNFGLAYGVSLVYLYCILCNLDRGSKCSAWGSFSF